MKQICLLLIFCISLIVSGCSSETPKDNQLIIGDYLSDFTGNIIKYNSSDMVDVNICFKNISDKSIDTIEFEITPYNSENEPVRRSATVKFDKIIKPDETVDNLKDNNVWCSDSIEYAIISDVAIEFYDNEGNIKVKTNNILTSKRLDKAPELPKVEKVPFLSDYLAEINGKTSSPNSAGGVDVTLEFKNYSDKTIKYITFDVVPYNSVDDPVFCDITDKSRISVRGTGPVLSNADVHTFKWENVWYNRTIDYFMIKEICIEFMDGEKVSFKLNKMIL